MKNLRLKHERLEHTRPAHEKTAPLTPAVIGSPIASSPSIRSRPSLRVFSFCPFAEPIERMPPWLRSLACAVIAVPLAAWLVGCDATIETIEPDERYNYSVFGYLDVAADTQWIRVDDINDGEVQGIARDFNAQVRLTNTSSGRGVMLRDSLTLVSGRLEVFNFWTTEPIEPSTTYRVEVLEDGEVKTEATTTTPPDQIAYRTYFRRAPSPFYFDLLVASVPRLAGARLVLEAENACVDDALTTTVASDAFPLSREYLPGTFQVRFRWADALRVAAREECAQLVSDNIDITLTSAGPDWPELASINALDTRELVLPDRISNVTGGHGYVGGIVTKRLTVNVTDTARVVAGDSFAPGIPSPSTPFNP